MKALYFVALIVVGAFLSGCADMRSGLVLDTVGPIPDQTPSAQADSGTLIVYSPNKVNADFNSPDPNRREHSDYTILNSGGQLAQRVRNVTGILEPLPVELIPGKYFVVARSNGYGTVKIPVIIVAGHDTVLHLDGFDAWPDQFNQTNTVRLPDGEIVGWKETSAF